MANNKDIALKNALSFFDGNELAATTHINKYNLKDKNEEYLEVDPLETITRTMKELADGMPEEKVIGAFYDKVGKPTCKLSRPTEEWLKRVLKEEYTPWMSDRAYTWLEIFGKACNNYKGVCPGGSVIAAAGDYEKLQSLSNCFVVPSPSDTIAGIIRTNEMMAHIYKRRGGCIEETQRVCIEGQGSIAIKDCKACQKILSFNTVTGKIEYKKIVDKFYTEVPKDNRLCLTFSNGTVLRTSENHPILVQTGKDSFSYKNAGKLNLGDINCITNTSFFDKDLIAYDSELEDVGWWIGCHMGDGTCGFFTNSYSRTSKKDGRQLHYKDTGLRLRILGDNESVVKSYAEITNKLCESKASYVLSSRKYYKSKVWEYSCNKNSTIAPFVVKYLDNQIGKKSYTGFTPQYVRENNLWLPFLAGLIDSDGYIGKDGRIFISLTSKNLINDVSGILTKFNISFHVNVKKDKRNEQWSLIYNLNIHKDRNFYSLLVPLLKHDIKKKRLLENIRDKYFSRSFKLFAEDIELINRRYERTKYSTNRYNKASPKQIKERNLLSANFNRIKKTNSIGLAALKHLLAMEIIDKDYYNNICSRVTLKGISQDTVSEKYIDVVVESNNNYFAGDFGFVCTHNCGVDLSTLRPEGASVNNAALKSSGAWGWANHFSNTCRDVAQNGRRGASILILHIKHPDAEKWAAMKKDLTYCTGANTSFWITDEFMEAVKTDSDFELKYPIDAVTPVYSRVTKARDLWNTICTSAWEMAEPGLLNYDQIVSTLPAHCYPGYEVVATNPCIPGWVSVLTKQGLRTLHEVTFGDEIWSSSGWTKIINKSSAGIKKVFKYTTNGGCFYGTKDHKVISEGKKVKASEAETIDTLKGCTYKVKIIPEAVMDGLVIGDGAWHKASNKPVLYIGKNDQDYALSEVTSLILNKCSVGTYCWDIKTSIKESEFNVTYNKSIPSRYFHADFDRVCSFLRGIYSANGSVVSGRVTLKTTSLKLLEQVQVMLSSVGIRTYYTKNKCQEVTFKNGTYICKKSYDLNITGDRDIFLEKIGFLQRYKNKKLERYIKKAKRKNSYKSVFDINEVEFMSEEEVYDVTVDNNSHTFWCEGLNIANCSEIPLSSFDACRLISIRLLDFVENAFTEAANFNFAEFEKNVRIAVRMGEGLIEAEVGHVKRIISKIEKEHGEAEESSKIEYQLELDLWKNVLKKGEEGRRLGLGDHGWADMFAQLCVRYDSDEALKLAKRIKKLYRDTAYDESIEMAKECGPFSIWDWEVEKDCEFFKTFPKELIKKMKKYGRRHVSLLTNAPTGSLSILGQCSSGIEPVFRHFYTRRRKINTNDKDSRVDFVDQNGDKWMEFAVCEKNIERYFHSINKEVPSDIKNEEELNKLLPDYFITSDKIDWKKRIEFQSALTEYVDHSISSTLNLPEDVSVETVKELYMYAWEKKLKGVTIYRENSRSGVLISNKKEELGHIVRSEAPNRPKKLPCEVHFTKVKGEEYIVIVGLLKGAVYEVFFGKYGNQIPNKHFSGHVDRRNKGKYYLCFYDEELLEYIEVDLNEYFDNTEYAAATRLISMSLRHGAPLAYVVSQLKKSSDNLTEFGSAVSRVLKKYIKVEDVQEQYRLEYGDNFEVRMEDGCMKIINLETGEVESKCD